jgi:hypothetical protein
MSGGYRCSNCSSAMGSAANGYSIIHRNLELESETVSSIVLRERILEIYRREACTCFLKPVSYNFHEFLLYEWKEALFCL